MVEVLEKTCNEFLKRRVVAQLSYYGMLSVSEFSLNLGIWDYKKLKEDLSRMAEEKMIRNSKGFSYKELEEKFMKEGITIINNEKEFIESKKCIMKEDLEMMVAYELNGGNLIPERITNYFSRKLNELRRLF